MCVVSNNSREEEMTQKERKREYEIDPNRNTFAMNQEGERRKERRILFGCSLVCERAGSKKTKCLCVQVWLVAKCGGGVLCLRLVSLASVEKGSHFSDIVQNSSTRECVKSCYQK